MDPRIPHYRQQRKYADLIFGRKNTKLILKPTANGSNPRIVAIAVSITGMIRILPACIAVFLVLIFLPLFIQVIFLKR